MALLVSACGFTEPNRKLIVIKETLDIDGSFLISSLVGQRLRLQNSGIVLVCCQQSMKFYDACGKKLGYNLTMSVGKKALHVIEPLKEVLNTSSEVDVIKRLYDDIKDRLDVLLKEGKKNVTIIIDDVTFFTNLGCSERDLINFSIKLHEFTETEGVSIILKIGLSDFHSHLTNNIEDFSDVILTLERLKSGDFWDVDGKLVIRKQTNMGELESERSLLYFIADHNVKLSAPGEFGLKV